MNGRDVPDKAVQAALDVLEARGVEVTRGDVADALAATLTPLYRVIHVQGRSPGLHRRAIRWVRWEWPSLWEALERLGVTPR